MNEYDVSGMELAEENQSTRRKNMSPRHFLPKIQFGLALD